MDFIDWMTRWLLALIFDGFHRLDDSMAPRLDFLWMTGSAGTAVDVLVTCFSKKGGGSERRGAKSLPRLVI